MVDAVHSAAEAEARTAQGTSIGGHRPQQQQKFNSTQPATANTPAQLARQVSGLCRSHVRYSDKAYSDKAYSCSGNCTWQGN